MERSHVAVSSQCHPGWRRQGRASDRASTCRSTCALDRGGVPADHLRTVNYDEFKAAFLQSLRESRLPTIGSSPNEEVLDLHSTDRTVTVYVEPIDRDIGGRFHVRGVVSWRWDALQAARTRSTEEDLLTELLGREGSHDVETGRPWLRVDIKLRAGLEYGKSIAMPSAATWQKWGEEALGRLENVERLVDEEVTRELPDGNLAILAWQGDPEIKVTCDHLGELRLHSISVSAFQGIDLPRRWDDSEREPDDEPHDQLAKMFKRVKAALHAWGEVMDHLT